MAGKGALRAKIVDSSRHYYISGKRSSFLLFQAINHLSHNPPPEAPSLPLTPNRISLVSELKE